MLTHWFTIKMEITLRLMLPLKLCTHPHCFENEFLAYLTYPFLMIYFKDEMPFFPDRTLIIKIETNCFL